jgi:zona occludens toxin
MAILAYTGLPGSGKSYNAVANVIKPALEKGRRVVTNIPLNKEVLDELGYSDQVHQFDSADYGDLEFMAQHIAPRHGAVFVLDEIWRLWPSGLQQSKMPKDQQTWLAEHRHHTGEDGYTDEIVLVTQRLAQLAAPVRTLIESQYQHVKLTKAGSSKSFTVKVFAGGDPNPREADIVNQLHGRYSPKLFRWYQSHTQAKTDEALESTADKRANVFRSPKFLAALGFAVFGTLGGLYLAANSLNSFASSTSETTEPIAASASGAVRVERSEARAAPVAAPTVAPVGPVVSQRWRVTGWYQALGERRVVLLESREGQTRRVTEGCDFSAGEPECELRGELVTRYSGAEPERRGFLHDAAGSWQDRVAGVE